MVAYPQWRTEQVFIEAKGRPGVFPLNHMHGVIRRPRNSDSFDHGERNNRTKGGNHDRMRIDAVAPHVRQRVARRARACRRVRLRALRMRAAKPERQRERRSRRARRPDRLESVQCELRRKLRLQWHSRDGKIVYMESDNTGDDALQARACLRGRSMRRWINHPDRLTKPMKRVGKRGEGKFEEISWDEAIDTIASELKRVIDTYGNEAIYVNYATGMYSCTGKQPGLRLLECWEATSTRHTITRRTCCRPLCRSCTATTRRRAASSAPTTP